MSVEVPTNNYNLTLPARCCQLPERLDVVDVIWTFNAELQFLVALLANEVVVTNPTARAPLCGSALKIASAIIVFHVEFDYRLMLSANLTLAPPFGVLLLGVVWPVLNLIIGLRVNRLSTHVFPSLSDA